LLFYVKYAKKEQFVTIFAQSLYMRIQILIISSLIILISCNEDISRRTDYAVEGIDISRYQQSIDWDAVAKQNMQFAYVKATEGGSLADVRFKQNWYTIKQVGMKRGAYHFFRPTVNALAQAKNFLDVAQLEPGDLPPVLDAEDADGVDKALVVTRMQTWLDIVEKRYGTKPVIYTSLKFYYNYIVGNFESYPLWIAKYGNVKPQLVNEKQFKFWQYTHKGNLEGIDGNVDMNVFLGSREELDALCIKPKVLYSNSIPNDTLQQWLAQSQGTRGSPILR
jgi:lysozyme